MTSPSGPVAAESLAREVRRLAFPAILHSLLQTLVFVVDRIMLGRHGEASLAAMQIGGAIEWSIWSVFAAFEVGTIARVGRHVGAKDPASARRAAWMSLATAIGVGIALALASPFLLDALPLVARRASPASLVEARRYLAVTIGASPIVFVAMSSIASLQAGGDTRTPLAIGVVANVLHIGMNRVLILGLGPIPGLGARGAGISTAITFALIAALSTAALASTRRPVSLRRTAPALGAAPPSSLPPLASEARMLAAIVLPAFVERVVYHAGFVSYALMVTALGEAAMAANQALLSVEAICFLSGDGFGIAAAALVAQKLGAGDPDGARRAARIAMRDAILLLGVCGVAAVALRGAVLPVFSADAKVVAIGRAAIPVLAFAQPFMAAGLVLAQALRGAGRTREALGVSAVGAVVVRLSATYFFAIVLHLGLVGVWLGSTSDWIVRSVLLGGLAVHDARRRGAVSGTGSSGVRA